MPTCGCMLNVSVTDGAVTGIDAEVAAKATISVVSDRTRPAETDG